MDNAALTAVANPTYWGHDERHPQNKLPYVSGIKLLIIANQSTALAAVRTGKIDAIDGLTLVQSQQMKTTNPAMAQRTYPGGPYTIDPKNDVKPFNYIQGRASNADGDKSAADCQHILFRHSFALPFYDDIDVHDGVDISLHDLAGIIESDVRFQCDGGQIFACGSRLCKWI